MSNYTQLGLIKQTDGENEGTWGDKLNESLIDLLDDAIGGYVEVSVASGNVTLAFADGTADNNGRHAVIKFTGSPGTTRTVTFPDAQVNYFIINGSDGSVICTSGSGAATVTIPTGMKNIIYVDGSDEILSMLSTPNISGNITIGVDDTGYDVKFFGATAGSYWLWDESADGVVQIGTLTVGVDDAGHDVKFFGNTASAYMLWDTSADDLVLAGAAGIDLAGDIDVDGTANLDNTDIDGTFAVDGTTISLDATTSLNIDNSNTSNGVTIGTATSGMPISIGHATSETTVNDNLTVTGTLTGTLATAAQGSVTSLGTLTALTVDDIALNGKVVTMTGSASDTAVFTAGTNGTLSIVTTDAAAAAANIQITADGTVDIDSAGILTLDSGAAINIEPASGSAILLDGTISIDAGVVTGATSITSTAFVGDITGDVTGNASGSAATVTTAAQTNITSLGTLTALTVDDVAINGKVITMTGSSSDTAIFTAGTHGTLSIVTTDAAAAAANIQITADGTAELAGTTVTLDSAADIELEATDDINIPSNVGLTFGNDGEKIEGDGSDLTISGNTVNLDSSMNHTFSSTGKAMVLGF